MLSLLRHDAYLGKGSLISDSLSKEKGQCRGGAAARGEGQGWSRMCLPLSGLEDVFTGYRKDTASPESSTWSASQET